MNDVDRLGLFVYGTLLPGEERWEFLEPFVTSDGTDLTVRGDLYDTGYGYPAAVFTHDPRYVGGTIRGRLFRLRVERYAEALDTLDQIEGAVVGAYQRVAVVTASGTAAWAYQVGDVPCLTPIADGDWRRWRSRSTT